MSTKPADTKEVTATGGSGSAANGAKPKDSAESAQVQQQIAELERIDRAVRAHERAHLAAAGGLAVSAATFSYRRGPDGKLYAVGGEVSIDTSPEKTPRETISKAGRIVAAALAPADPSAQDHAVANHAEQMAMSAQQELMQESMRGGESTDTGEGEAPAAGTQSETGVATQAQSPQRGIAGYLSTGSPAGVRGSQVDYSA